MSLAARGSLSVRIEANLLPKGENTSALYAAARNRPRLLRASAPPR